MKYLAFILLICFGHPVIWAQQPQQSIESSKAGIEKISSLLSNYALANPQEKIHIHFNRDNYNLEDTVWFKIYVVNPAGNLLSELSKVVHLQIELPNGSIKRMLLPVYFGTAIGQLVLTDSLYQGGKYTIKAYTQLMRNRPENEFFQHSFYVNGTTVVHTPVAAKESKANEKMVIAKDTLVVGLPLSFDFFPEGGNLIQGIRSRIAFKAVGADGMGKTVNGYVENEKGEQVAIFNSLHAGMGVFALKPIKGSTYTAVISEGAYRGRSFVLPKAMENGYAISVNQKNKDSLQLNILRTEDLRMHKDIKLVIQTNGVVQQALVLPFSNSSISFVLPTAQMAEGINQLTIFSSAQIPIAERLVFVAKSKLLQPTLQSDKAEYGKREQVKFNLKIADQNEIGIVGSYSVAIVNTNQFAFAEAKQLSIYGNLLLSAELKGNIEDPNYYFIDQNELKAAELDVLLMTQGWRRFKWTDVLAENTKAPKYKIENGLVISGQVTTMDGKPVANAKVNLLAAKDMLVLDTVGDAQGRFSFTELDLGDSAVVILRAKGAKESNNVKIIIDEPYAFLTIPKTIATTSLTTLANVTDYIPSPPTQQTRKIVQGTTLKTVQVVGKRKHDIQGSIYPIAAAPPDITIEPDLLQEMTNVEDYLRARFPGIEVIGNRLYGMRRGGRGRMVILLNGRSIDDLSGINPRSLSGVQIIKGSTISDAMATVFMITPEVGKDKPNPSFGIVILTMAGIPDKFIKVDRPSGFLQYPMKGYSYSREFYAPKYNLQKELPNADFRSTLFWKPDIITGDDGKAEFDFYTSDETGVYQVTLEGIGINGQLSRKISYFVVK